MFPDPMHITPNTTVYYGDVRAKVFRKYAPKTKIKKKRWPEQLCDPLTGHEMGIQENDLWIVAHALEEDLILVSHDKHMVRIKDALPDLFLEDWAE